MARILFIALLVSIAVLCCFAAIANLVRRRRQPKRPALPLENLELLKEQGMISEEEFESMKEGAQRPQELPIESCTLSSEEMMEAIEAALGPVNDLQLDSSYAGDKEWAGSLGVEIQLNMDLKELTLLSMKMVKPRPPIDLIAELLAMRIPVDLFSTQAGDEANTASALPNYKTAARMIWTQARERLSEPISIQKEIHEKRKLPERRLLADLIPLIMKTLNIPVTAVGFAAILALMVAKMDFKAFSDDEEDES